MIKVGKRQKLKMINIFTEEGKINKNAPNQYVGMDRFEARKKIIEKVNLLGDKLISYKKNV